MSLADQSQRWCPTSVQVTVLQARGLRIKGKHGTNDAYVVMKVAKEKYATLVVEKSVAPVWEEEAAFDLPPPPLHHGSTERCTLHVHVLHRALVGPDKLLGQAVINLLELSQVTSRDKTEWFKLLDKAGKSDKDRGEVLLDIQFMRNNMTASMVDLSATGKPRSRMGKFKDKVRGKKKEGLSDATSAVVPSFTQVLTDSEEEGAGDGYGEGAAGKEEKKKKHKLKSLFSPKSNLQRNLSQSMSILPEKNSALSGSISSGLNVDSSEGKKKFKFMIHKRSGSSDSKGSQGTLSIPGHRKQGSAPAVEQSNLCVNGSHIYCEEPQPRSSRTGSTFSLASSGHGSMEDFRRTQVPESSATSIDSLRKQYSPWTEEEDSSKTAEVGEVVEEEVEEEEETAELERMRTVERRGKVEEEEEKKRLSETEDKEMIRKIEEQESIIHEQLEKRRFEEDKIILIEQESRMIEEEEKIRGEEQQKIRMEEERAEEERRRRQAEEERVRKEEEESERLAGGKGRLEEQERRKLEEEEKIRREEQERIRMEEERAEEERRRREEEERVRKEEEESERLAEEKRRLEEQERIRMEEDRAEEERRRRQEEEERVRKEEEESKKLAEEKRRLEEQERRRIEEEKKIRREEQKRIRMEEEERAEEERRRRQEEERIRKEEEESERLAEEQERRKFEEEEKIRREEQERIRMEEERRRRQEEERVRKEEEESERLAEEKRRLEEQERRRIEEEEKIRREEQERIRMEEERAQEERRRRQEEDRVRKEEDERERLVEEKKRLEEQERLRKAEDLQIKREEEKRMESMRREEEKLRKEEEEKVIKDEEERIERINEEKSRKKEEERVRKEEDMLRREMEKKRLAEEGERLKREENRLKEERRLGGADETHLGLKIKVAVESSTPFAEVTSTNPFDDTFSNNPFEEIPNSPAGPLSRTAKVSTAQPSSHSCLIPPQPFVPSNPNLQPSELETRALEHIATDLLEKKHHAPLPPSDYQLPQETPFYSTLNFTQTKSYNLFPTSRYHSAVPLVGSKEDLSLKETVYTDENDPISTKRDKRPAPQPPGRYGAERQIQREQDVSTLHVAQMNKQSRDKDVKTSNVFPQHLVQKIAPLSRSSSTTKNVQVPESQSSTHSSNQPECISSTTGTSRAAKHNKGPAPSRPHSSYVGGNTLTQAGEDGPFCEPKRALSSDANQKDSNKPHGHGSVAKQVPAVFGSNPFEDDETETQLTAQNEITTSANSMDSCSHQSCASTNSGSLDLAAPAPQTPDEDGASQTRGKSSKMARAPPPPANKAATSSILMNQNTGRRLASKRQDSVTDVAVPDNSVTQGDDTQSEAISSVSDQKTLLPVISLPSETQTVTAQGIGEEAGGKWHGRPSTSRRLHPVKPLSPLEQQSVSVIQGQSTAILSGVQEKVKVNEAGLKGPYSQLTQKELISLVLKQDSQLLERDQTISELEQYIDNLLVRVIEESPSILMSIGALKKDL